MRPKWIVLSLALLLGPPLLMALDKPTPPPRRSQAVVRLEGPIYNPKINSTGKLLAFTDSAGRSLRILDLSNHEVIEVSPHRIGPAFFWSPDGVRLFYRELVKQGKAIESLLQAYDSHLNKASLLETLEGSSGYLTYAPYQQTAYLLHEKGILAKHLDFPGLRPAHWQKKKQNYEGQWIATQQSILWLTDLGLTLKKMDDDGSGVASFSVSPDGHAIAWATTKGQIYASVAENLVPLLIDQGRDPSWHPYRTLLAYAGARRVGNRTYDYDLKVSDLHAPPRYLQTTPDRSERWPIWISPDVILHTAGDSTDLLKLSLQPPAPIAKIEVAPGTKQ